MIGLPCYLLLFYVLLYYINRDILAYEINRTVWDF
jgi:hypothetical protein